MMRRAVIVIILVIAALLGAAREYLFINLNYQVDHVRRATEFSYADSHFKAWTLGWSLGQLNALKWILAVSYIVIMTSLAVWMSKLLFGGTRYSRPIVFAVVVVSCLALLLHALSGWLPPLADVAVKMLHMVQYPVVLLILLAARGLGVRPT